MLFKFLLTLSGFEFCKAFEFNCPKIFGGRVEQVHIATRCGAIMMGFVGEFEYSK